MISDINEEIVKGFHFVFSLYFTPPNFFSCTLFPAKTTHTHTHTHTHTRSHSHYDLFFLFWDLREVRKPEDNEITDL